MGACGFEKKSPCTESPVLAVVDCGEHDEGVSRGSVLRRIPEFRRLVRSSSVRGTLFQLGQSGKYRGIVAELPDQR